VVSLPSWREAVVTTARETILTAVRAARPAPVALPDVDAAVATFPPLAGELTRRFADAVRASGARVVEAARSEVKQVVGAAYADAQRLLSRIPELQSTVTPPTDLHELANLDLFICEAALGVAENGGVWLPSSAIGMRASLFLANDVAIVLDRTRVVATMHDAYARVDCASESYGVFVAGPSKTADIEQSLVIGAQGAKSLTIVLV
jgi:L-lactate dehydrogenase complex protein LldG